jgi:nicotinamidase-related amidase
MMSNVSKFWLDRHQSVLVVIDVQERLVPSMDQKVYQRVKSNIEFMIKTAEALQIPVVVTEQYPQGLGTTVADLAGAAGDTGVIEKLSFGCCGEPSFIQRLQELGRANMLLTGMEAHVCVYQTVLGLIEAGFNVHLLRDAVCSRYKVDFLNSLELARSAGAIVTTAETVAFQLLKVAGSSEFKVVSKLVREK